MKIAFHIELSMRVYIYVLTKSQQVKTFRPNHSITCVKINMNENAYAFALAVIRFLLFCFTCGISPRETLTKCQWCYDPFRHQLRCDKTASMILSLLKIQTIFSLFKCNMKIAQRVYSWVDNKHFTNGNMMEKKNTKITHKTKNMCKKSLLQKKTKTFISVEHIFTINDTIYIKLTLHQNQIVSPHLPVFFQCVEWNGWIYAWNTLN